MPLEVGLSLTTIVMVFGVLIYAIIVNTNWTNWEN